MTHDPVTGKVLDDRFEYPVYDGPTLERICDGYKYQGVRDHVEVRFTYIDGDIKDTNSEKDLRGTVCGIMGTPRDPHSCIVVYFIPSFDRSTDPTPWEIIYWPNRKKGHVINVRKRKLFLERA